MKTVFRGLDLFCKAGGASAGYALAGFEMTGIDKDPQPNYPYRFIQSDAFEYVREHGHEYDFIHASPPCQRYSNSTAIARSKGKTYPDLLDRTRRELLRFDDVPIIIENVSNAPIRPDLVLKGYMFGLKIIRKRKFEIHNFFMLQPGIGPKYGSVKDGDYCCVFGKGSFKKSKDDAYPKFRLDTVRETWSYAMGINHYMTDLELAEAIPPAYTRYIGEYLFTFLNQHNQTKIPVSYAIPH